MSNNKQTDIAELAIREYPFSNSERNAFIAGYNKAKEMHEEQAIKLPSDEEVGEFINTFPYTKHLDDGQYNDGVIVGAELGIQWMRDKIQGGNK